MSRLDDELKKEGGCKVHMSSVIATAHDGHKRMARYLEVVERANTTGLATDDATKELLKLTEGMSSDEVLYEYGALSAVSMSAASIANLLLVELGKRTGKIVVPLDVKGYRGGMPK